MKAIVCEMCNSHDIVKKDGMYICESCGTKYTTEEEKKMMVDITGSTVKIDTSEKLKNMYEVARRAKNDNNSETAAKYYDMILMEDPSSWEASFYSSYYSAMQCKIMNIASAAYKVKNAAVTTVNLIKDSVSDAQEQEKALADIVTNTIIIGTLFHSSAKNHHSSHNFNDANYRQKHNQEYIDRAAAAANMLYALGDEIEKLFTSESVRKLASLCWQSGVNLNREYMYLLSMKSKEINNNIINSYVDKACKNDKDYATKLELGKVNSRIAVIDKQIKGTKVKYRKGALAGAIIAGTIALIALMGEYYVLLVIALCFGGLSGAFIPRTDENQKKQLEIIENLNKERAQLVQKKAELEKK